MLTEDQYRMLEFCNSHRVMALTKRDRNLHPQ